MKLTLSVGWLAGWMFTLSALDLTFWAGIGAFLAWPWFLGNIAQALWL